MFDLVQEEIILEIINHSSTEETDFMRSEISLKKEDFLLPLFTLFMLKKGKIKKFTDIYNSDPEYYYSLLKQKTNSEIIIFKSMGLNGEKSINAIKALAVHFSERKKDRVQVEKFYQHVIRTWSLAEKVKDSIVHLDLEGIKCMEISEKKKNNNKKNELELFYMHLWATLAEYVYNKNKVITTRSFCKIWISGLYFDYCGITNCVPEICEGFSNESIQDEFLSVLKINSEKEVTIHQLNIIQYFSYSSLDMDFIDKALKIIDDWNKIDDITINITRLLAVEMITQSISADLKLHYFVLSYLEMEAQMECYKKKSEIVCSISPSETISQPNSFYNQKPEELFSMIERKEKEIRDSQNTIYHLEKKIKRLTDKHGKLEKQVEDLKRINEELLSIEDDEDENETTINLRNPLTEHELSQLSELQIVVVGGHEHFHRELSKVIHYKVIEPETSQIDANIIRNADIVCFITNYLCHRVFYHVHDLAKNKKITESFHNSNNINRFCRDILKKIQ